jgi:hypothetical protein
MQRLRRLRPTGTTPETEATAPAAPGDDSQEVSALLAPPQAPDELGRLGPYRVLQVLGCGGMGVVFAAEDPQLRRPVALKVLRPALAAGGAARERFLREARAAAGIDHDHVITVYQVGEDRGVPFLAMPLLQGESLADRLRREQRLPVPEVLRIGGELAEGLAAAHAKGLVHRDIKPSNVWLAGGHGRVKLLDFGLARAAAGEAHLTRTGVVVGTAAYMAPEQARGGEVDARSDLFSLGCVLYQMATGAVPFRGSDTLSTLTSLAVDRPRPPHEVNPAVPPALSDLVMHLLVRSPCDRPPSAATVVASLESIERPRARVMPAPTASPRRRRLLGAVAAAVLLALLGWAGYQLAPVVIRIATDKGEVVLRTDDPDVEVTVRQHGKVVEVLDRKTRQKVELPSGEYEAAVDGDRQGLRLSATTFTLRRGATQIVSVERAADTTLPARNGQGTCPLDALRRANVPPYELEVAGAGEPDKAPPELAAVFGDSPPRHWGWVSALTFSPDGKTLASGSLDRTIRLWDTATGQHRRTLRGTRTR